MCICAREFFFLKEMQLNLAQRSFFFSFFSFILRVNNVYYIEAQIVESSVYDNARKKYHSFPSSREELKIEISKDRTFLKSNSSKNNVKNMDVKNCSERSS